MDRMLSHFGSAGNYTCLGKNIALLEMYKFVPAVIRHFEVRSCTQNLILNEPLTDRGDNFSCHQQTRAKTGDLSSAPLST
jgi:hypothetical protein